MSTIYHLTTRTAWNIARENGPYRPESLSKEGFIHCSRRDQVVDVANSLFVGLEGAVLLAIDESRVEVDIIYEDCYETGEAFPHIYGPLALGAVTNVIDFPCGEDGQFQLPPELEDNKPATEG